MKTVHSDGHRGHGGAKAFHLGEMVPIHESPRRIPNPPDSEEF